MQFVVQFMELGDYMWRTAVSVSTCESECRWLMPGSSMQDCMHPTVALYQRLLAKSWDMVQSIIHVRVHLRHEADRYSVQNRWFLVKFIPHLEVETSIGIRQMEWMLSRSALWYSRTYCIVLVARECLPSLSDQCSCSDWIHSEVVLLSEHQENLNFS